MTSQMIMISIEAYLDKLFELGEHGVESTHAPLADRDDLYIDIEDMIDTLLELQAQGYTYITVAADPDSDNKILMAPVKNAESLSTPYEIDPNLICPN